MEANKSDYQELKNTILGMFDTIEKTFDTDLTRCLALVGVLLTFGNMGRKRKNE